MRSSVATLHDSFNKLEAAHSRSNSSRRPIRLHQIGVDPATTVASNLIRVRQRPLVTAVVVASIIRLLPHADVVLMDLRGFSKINLGCIFELTQIVNLVSLDRILIIVD
jgi:hypothetical protein